ncbi:MAG: response regulator transcription factor [Elusimicrobia bacterium]|nr:response regulator transcription factor [Elusimicrobiota bacterium]
MQYSVLAVDDDEDILELIKETLQQENISVITAKTGNACIKKAEISRPDLIILDLDLPDIPGDKVYKILKKENSTSSIPVMILTGSKISTDDIAFGLNEGACEYVIKPFDPKVLTARVKNIFHWLDYKVKIKEVVKKCGLEIDAKQRRVKVNGSIVDLTKKEFDLLSTLIRGGGRVLSHRNLLETVWGYEDMASAHTLESHVSSLKKKLGPYFARKIITVKGIGYKLDV